MGICSLWRPTPLQQNLIGFGRGPAVVWAAHSPPGLHGQGSLRRAVELLDVQVSQEMLSRKVDVILKEALLFELIEPPAAKNKALEDKSKGLEERVGKREKQRPA